LPSIVILLPPKPEYVNGFQYNSEISGLRESFQRLFGYVQRGGKTWWNQ